MFTVELLFEKATKNTIRFRSEDYGTVYVPNQVYADLGQPKALNLTLEPAAAPVALTAA